MEKMGLEGYRKVFKYMPDIPEVKKIIKRRRKLIIINLAAREDAKIIKLQP